jgi:hypothetical protein
MRRLIHPELVIDLHQTITKVRTAKPSMVRTRAAEHLAQLTKKITPDEVDDRALEDLIPLLDTSDDSMRAWVAVKRAQTELRDFGTPPNPYSLAAVNQQVVGKSVTVNNQGAFFSASTPRRPREFR